MSLTSVAVLQHWAYLFTEGCFPGADAMIALTSKKIDLGGCVMHCLECGDPEGLPVILLHGMKFQAATWQELGTLDFLSGLGLHVFAVDMPGFGQSPACEGEPVALLHRFVEHMGFDQVVVLGPSMGGRIALEFGIKYPQRLAGLILVGPVGVEENRSRLFGITASTLIVWGAEDQISPLATSDILLAGLSHSRRDIFPDAPHPCYLAQPERWHDCLRTFFATLTI
jgi:abhydrolase domain-containing protein 14